LQEQLRRELVGLEKKEQFSLKETQLKMTRLEENKLEHEQELRKFNEKKSHLEELQGKREDVLQKIE
jgi:hypothetical protein